MEPTNETINLLYVGLDTLKVGVGITGVIVFCNTMKGIAKNYSLVKRNGNFVRIDSIPKDIGIVPTQIDKTGIKKEASVIIRDFVIFLRENGFNTDYFFKNFKPYSIEETTRRNKSTLGHYDYELGKILIDPDNVGNTLFRGLLEEASTFQCENFIAQGFERINIDSDMEEKTVVSRIGRGFNTVYTHILMDRYYVAEPNYKELLELLNIIELIVGKDAMERAYFRGDLGTLYYKIPLNWIQTIDYLFEVLYINKNSIVKKSAEKTYRQLFVEIAKMGIKVAQELEKDKIGNKNSFAALELMNDLNFLLSVREKKGRNYGLLESDYDIISQYAKDVQSSKPYYLHVQMPYSYEYRKNSGKRI